MRSLPGTSFSPQFAAGPPTGVIYDIVPGISRGAYTTGATRVATINTSPTLSAHWSVLGWSARLLAAFIKIDAASTNVDAYGRWGTLKAGLGIDANLSNASKPVTPTDLSTFTEIWDPNTQDAPVLSSGVSQDDTAYLPIGETFMFPAPIKVNPGATLQFALILTPSLLGLTPFNLTALGLQIRSADFTLLYQD
jgi:hypothetical protein